MPFPRPWSLVKVCIIALLWLVVVFGLALALTIRNVGGVVMAHETVYGISLFADAWPPWVPFLAWVPPLGLVLWRVLSPPLAIPPAGTAV